MPVLSQVSRPELRLSGEGVPSCVLSLPVSVNKEGSRKRLFPSKDNHRQSRVYWVKEPVKTWTE